MGKIIIFAKRDKYQKNARHDVRGELGVGRVSAPIDWPQVVAQAGLQKTNQALGMLFDCPKRIRSK